MEFFLLPIPVWFVILIYAFSLVETILAAARYLGHWAVFIAQAVGILLYTFYNYSSGMVESVGILQYALFLQVVVIVLATYGGYRWYSVSWMHWRSEHDHLVHVLDRSEESGAFQQQPIRILTFSHYVALTFVVIVLWLFLAKMYSLEVTMRASNQGLVGLVAFVLTLHYLGNFLLAHFFLEAWMLRFLARLIEGLFLYFKGINDPVVIGLLAATALANLWGWWRWRRRFFTQ